ncbi:MAG: hypothetical protein NTY88_11220 [Bacteroidetes bacterium]|nr:hypothetical protein [Bacteroidota bacterium]
MSLIQRIACFLFLVSVSGCKPKLTTFLSRVKLLSPSDAGEVYLNQIPFTWENFNIFSTRLQIAADASFATMLLDSSINTQQVNFNGVSLFDLGKTYYWRVQADPNAGEILFSDTRSFKIVDTRDSIKGTYTAQFHSTKWSLLITDTIFNTTVVISKINPNKLHVVCTAAGWLPDMLPYPDDVFFHYGDQGILPIDSSFKSCMYDTLLRKISLEYYSGTVNPGYHYWFTIYK